MIRFLTFSLLLLMVLVGCTERGETPKPEKESSMAEKVTDPVCGMEIEKDAAMGVEYDGTTYYVCSNECKEEFLNDPGTFAKTDRMVDPVCGMEISPSSEYLHKYHDKTYYFCSPECKEQFEKEPEEFLRTK